jgi:membrane peptidoglycan carboxypeptidase
VAARLPALLGEDVVARGGLTVTTSLDLGLHERLQALAAEHVAALAEAHDLTDAAVVALRPGSGEVLALVGGIDYDRPGDGQVNAATSPRQSGSAFKPITYAAALERGWTPASLLWDIPMSFGDGSGGSYQPVNYDGRYRGPVRLRQALAGSLNAAAVGLLADVGLPEVHALALRMGLPLDPDPWHYGLALTLGAADVPLLDLTAAFAAFGAGGRWTAPQPVLRVQRAGDGAELFRAAPAPEAVVSEETAWLVSDILSDTSAREPVFAADGPLTTSRPAAVKTGTTNDFRDNLTVGYTPYLAVGVWAGNKDGRPMRDVLGITGAAPIWHDAMEAVFADERLLALLGDGALPAPEFPVPPGIVQADVCDLNTVTDGGLCRQYQEVFGARGPDGDFGSAFDWFTVGGGAGDTRCGEAGAPGAEVLLVPPRDPALAAQVRRWAADRDILVAPGRCDEPSEARAGTGAAAYGLASAAQP